MQRINAYMKELSGGKLELSDKQLEQFERYYEMLIETNKVMNLTAITEREDVITKHFIDSIALAGYYDLTKKGLKVIDVGTGAGFPGIPLKIAFPNLNITLFDSLNKRVKFLNSVIEELGLSNEQGEIVAVHGRAEEGGQNKSMREQYDLVVSRAVANMAVLSEYALPFVKENGYYIYYERNEDMQEYMVEDNRQPIEEKETMQEIVKEKKERMDSHKLLSFMYTVCTFLIVVVLVMAINIMTGTKRLSSIETGVDNLGKVVEVKANVQRTVAPETVPETIQETSISEHENVEDTTHETKMSHIVKAGENLATISKMYYGDTKHIKEIMELNNIKNQDKIYPGQELKLP